MIKKCICVLLLLGAVVAVVFAALNSSNSNSLLMQYLDRKMWKQQNSEQVEVCDTIPVDTTLQM